MFMHDTEGPYCYVTRTPGPIAIVHQARDGAEWGRAANARKLDDVSRGRWPRSRPQRTAPATWLRRPGNAMPLSAAWGYRSDKARHDREVLQIRLPRVRRRVILGRRRGRYRG